MTLRNPANADLLRSLGKLVRGLSALFWGLPVALIVCVQAAETDVFGQFAFLPPVLATAWLLFGVWQLGHFQKQERIWLNALDRAKLLAVSNLGLSPFLYWSSRRPAEVFFTTMVEVMAVAGLMFLGNLNLVLRRLTAMLPDENLRAETRQFTMLNRFLVLAILLLGLVVVGLQPHQGFLHYLSDLPGRLGNDTVSSVLENLWPGGLWVMLFLVLLPLAMTMALLWKTKEVILESVFGA